MPLTHAPDPVHLLAGAGTAAEQEARPQLVADHVNGGWVTAPSPPDHLAVKPNDVFADTNITAEDASNGTELGTLGYMPVGGALAPSWTVGQFFTANATYRFHWINATGWVPGPVPVVGTRSAPARTTR